MTRLGIIAIMVIFFSCNDSKDDIKKKFESYFSKNQTNFFLAKNKSDSLYKKWKITNTNSFSDNYEEASISLLEDKTALYTKIDSVVNNECKSMVLENLNLMHKLSVNQISIGDGIALFSLKEQSLSLRNDIYIYYTVHKIPTFQEIDLTTTLVSPDMPNRWAYKLKNNWFLIVLQRAL
jgi:hypothetical protein